MDKLRVAFIGAGRIADLHALAYRPSTSSGQAPDAQLHAVCDADAQVAAARAREMPTRADLVVARLNDPRVEGFLLGG